MKDNIVNVLDKDGNSIQCILLTIFEHDNNLYMIYKEKDNDSFTKDILASKVLSYKNNTYNLVPLSEKDWFYVEKEYNQLLNKIKSGEINGI